MSEYDVKYKIGDEVSVKGRISHVEIYKDKVYYKLRETNDLIPQDIIFSDKTEKLIDLSRNVADYLQKNFHPHTTVIIEVDSIRVEETLASEVIEYKPN